MDDFLIIMALPMVYGLACLAVLVIALAWLRLGEKEMTTVAKKLFFGLMIILFGRIAWLFASQYLAWHSHPSSQYFLPPYQSIWYFLQYGWFRFARPEIVSLGVACFFFLMFLLLQRLSRGRIFYNDEVYIAGIGFAVNVWPENLLIIVLVLLSGLLWGGVAGLFRKTKDSGAIHVSTRLFWPLWSAIMLVAGKWLITVFGLDVLRL